jgi:hypothetical protein
MNYILVNNMKYGGSGEALAGALAEDNPLALEQWACSGPPAWIDSMLEEFAASLVASPQQERARLLRWASLRRSHHRSGFCPGQPDSATHSNTLVWNINIQIEQIERFIGHPKCELFVWLAMQDRLWTSNCAYQGNHGHTALHLLTEWH